MLNLKKLLTKVLAITQESLTYSNGTTSVTFLFRCSGAVLSVLVSKGDASMTLPTTWTAVGTLSSIRPQGARLISLPMANGAIVMLMVMANGDVRIISSTASPIWVQSSGTVIYK